MDFLLSFYYLKSATMTVLVHSFTLNNIIYLG